MRCARTYTARSSHFRERRTSYCLIVLSRHHHQQQRPRTPLHLPHHSDSWKQNSSDLFCCRPPPSPSLTPNCPIPPFLSHPPATAPLTPPPPPSPPLTVVIGSAGIIQRLDIIYCLPCTIPPSHSRPLFSIAQGALRMN